MDVQTAYRRLANTHGYDQNGVGQRIYDSKDLTTELYLSVKSRPLSTTADDLADKDTEFELNRKCETNSDNSLTAHAIRCTQMSGRASFWRKLYSP